MSARNEITVAAEVMAAKGLFYSRTPQRCQLCRRMMHWLSPERTYCFADIVEQSVTMISPPAPLLGTLSEECDPSMPTLYMRRRGKKRFKVEDNSSANWDGAMLQSEDISRIETARIRIMLNGEQLN